MMSYIYSSFITVIKTASIFGSVLLVFIASYFFYEDQQVSVQPSIPSTVRPGDEFNVELMVNKGNLSGFASLQQYLPDGFTATALETAHAEFVFDQQHVTFTWKDLPEETSFRISYKIKINENCSGLKTMNGSFAYIESDQTKKIQLTPSVIIVSADAPVSDARSQEPERETVVEKQIIPLTARAGEYKVELKVLKGTNQHAVRIFDQVIEDYTAYPLDTKGAKFTVADGMAEFYWETIPKDSVFTVSYHIVSDRIHVDYSISNLLTADQDQSKNTGITASISTSNDNPVVATKAPSPQPANPVTPALPGGIYYKVQIAATMHTAERTNNFFRSKYKIDEAVDMAVENGWNKYLIGRFEKYAAAKQHGTETQAKIPDAFVVAFENGERIPLHRALKASRRN